MRLWNQGDDCGMAASLKAEFGVPYINVLTDVPHYQINVLIARPMCR